MPRPTVPARVAAKVAVIPAFVVGSHGLGLGVISRHPIILAAGVSRLPRTNMDARHRAE